jgi:hypothetical protein
LRFKLAGVDTVVSTISGSAQLTLIDCAAAARVRRFVPSEFGGPPALRPADDPLDNQRRAAIVRLSQREASGMRFCVFTCGILYERFAPGGMAASQIGVNSNIGQEGAYLMNFRQRTAQLPYNSAAGNVPQVSMISARDLTEAVVKSLSLSSWPREFRVRGERMSVRELVSVAEMIQGMFCERFVRSWTDPKPGRNFEVQRHTRKSVADALVYARAVHDKARELQLHHLVATAEGRYDFAETNLNQLINLRPESFHDYLVRVWSNRS